MVPDRQANSRLKKLLTMRYPFREVMVSRSSQNVICGALSTLLSQTVCRPSCNAAECVTIRCMAAGDHWRHTSGCTEEKHQTSCRCARVCFSCLPRLHKHLPAGSLSWAQAARLRPAPALAAQTACHRLHCCCCHCGGPFCLSCCAGRPQRCQRCVCCRLPKSPLHLQY
jgi:hypothetical protein